jgi:RimJ/RimL family protein N-acetyltransferase
VSAPPRLPDTLRTPRLIAERFEWRHLPLLDAFNKDERVMHWFGGVGTTDETRAWLAARMHLWEERGFGPYVLFEAGDAGESGGAGGARGAAGEAVGGAAGEAVGGAAGEAVGGAAGEAAPGPVAGRAGLQTVEVDGVEEVELIYALVPEAQGRGYATEIGRALVAAAFDVLGRADVMAYIRPDNPRSRRVLEKLGFAYERDWRHEGRVSEIYRVRAADVRRPAAGR